MKKQINNEIKNQISESVYLITASAALIFSMGVCTGFGAFIPLLCIIAVALFVFPGKPAAPMTAILGFLVMSLIFDTYGASACVVSGITAGILLIISVFFKDKLSSFSDSPACAALMLSGAITSTVLFTTDYFGIGATGKTVTEMIKSYVSLGFHPNWRGILYGTIVMVIMITFPRKFKKVSKTVKASYIALIFTVLLNLLLIPDGMIKAINEVGKVGDAIKPGLPDFSSLGARGLIFSILCGIALWIVMLYSRLNDEDSTKSDYTLSGAFTFLLSPLFGFFMPCRPVKKLRQTLLNCIALIILVLLPCLLFPSLIERMPVHSCAVVLIVGAWQSVKWSKLKNAFSNPVAVISFIVIMAASLLLNIAFGIIFAAIITLINEHETKTLNQPKE